MIFGILVIVILAITACIVDLYLEDKRHQSARSEVNLRHSEYLRAKITELSKAIDYQKQLILGLQLENCNLKTKPAKKSKRSKK
jgi:hypothetical protein